MKLRERRSRKPLTLTSRAGSRSWQRRLGEEVLTPATIANSVIAGNAATAIAPHGQAVVLGAGLVNQGPLLLQNDLITLNKGTVHGQTELAQGGGIYNGSTWSPGGPITLQNTSVIGNVLAGDVGATLQGAGLYTVGFPATLTHSLVAHNSPDQCVGVSC